MWVSMPVTPSGRASSTLTAGLLVARSIRGASLPAPGCPQTLPRGRAGEAVRVQGAEDQAVAWLRVEEGGLLRQGAAALGDVDHLGERRRAQDQQGGGAAALHLRGGRGQVVLVDHLALEVGHAEPFG